MERIVTRSEILSSDGSQPSSSPDPELYEKLKTLGKYSFVDEPAQPHEPSFAANETAEDDFEFQLFATSKPPVGSTNHQDTTAASQKVRLRSISPRRDPGFINPDRDQSYYFTSSSSKPDFSSSAVSGLEVLSRSRTPWPGTSYPWKVLQLPPSGEHKSIRTQSWPAFRRLVDEPLAKAKRTRPGKKYRIKLRTKIATAQAKREVKQKEAEGAERAEREKRARRNREKKFKKRARDKAKKAEKSGEGATERNEHDGTGSE